MKICNKCKQQKPSSEFYRHDTNRDRLSGQCKKCLYDVRQVNYQNNKEEIIASKLKHQKERREANQIFVRTYLQGHSCADCEEPDWIVLEFDHVRGKKRCNISKMIFMGYALKTLVEEVKKCDVVCRNCHVRRTYRRENSWRVQEIA
jgi:hypothetical protein